MLEKIFYMLPFNRIKTYVFPITESNIVGNNINVTIKTKIGVKDLPEVLKNKRKVIDVLVIPEGVTEIDRDTFENCKIRKVIFPKSLKNIGFSAFSYNPFLKEIELNDGLEFIGLYAFANTSLKKVNIPDSVKVIQSSVFKRCSNLKEVKLPSNLKKIEDGVFSDTAIKSIEIPESVKEIDSGAFWGCKKLKTVKFPDRLEKLGRSVFSYSGVKHIYLNDNIKEIHNEFFNYDNSIKTITVQFPSKRGTIEKYKINKKIRKFDFIEKGKDGYVIETKPIVIGRKFKFTNTHVITTEGYVRLDTFKLYKLTNNIKVFKDNLYKGIETQMPKWIDGIEKRKKGGKKVSLPKPYIITNYPNNTKDIIRYYIMESKFQELVVKVGFNDSDPSSLLKICFVLGFFSDNKEESERAFNFIGEKLSNGMTVNEMNTIFGSLRRNIGYNREFAKFYIENYKDKSTFEIDGFDITIKMIEQFKDIADSIKNQKKNINIEDVKRYLSTQKYLHREGNGLLAMTISNYSEFYDQSKFDKLQDIFEQGKELAKNGGKIIAQTSDKETNRATYFWSPSDNPINLVLGHADKASCCAKLDGLGREIMISAVVSPEVQNLIIFDRNKNIIGKGTAYFNKEEKYILFNNAEMNPTWMARATNEEKDEVLDAFLRAARDQAKALNLKSDEPVITKIHMGMRLNDITEEIESKKLKIIKKQLLENKVYGHYSGDANSPSGQVVLYETEGGKKK